MINVRQRSRVASAEEKIMDLIVSEEIIAVGDKLSWESVRVREKIG